MTQPATFKKLQKLEIFTKGLLNVVVKSKNLNAALKVATVMLKIYDRQIALEKAKQPSRNCANCTF
jgi:hypothetical protein